MTRKGLGTPARATFLPIAVQEELDRFYEKGRLPACYVRAGRVVHTNPLAENEVGKVVAFDDENRPTVLHDGHCRPSEQGEGETTNFVNLGCRTLLGPGEMLLDLHRGIRHSYAVLYVPPNMAPVVSVQIVEGIPLLDRSILHILVTMNSEQRALEYRRWKVPANVVGLVTRRLERRGFVRITRRGAVCVTSLGRGVVLLRVMSFTWWHIASAFDEATWLAFAKDGEWPHVVLNGDEPAEKPELGGRPYVDLAQESPEETV